MLSLLAGDSGATRRARVAKPLLAAAAAALFAATAGYVIRIGGEIPAPASEQALLVGRELPSLPGYRWGAHSTTLVLALRVGCPYCLASVPFYRQIVQRDPAGAHILAVFPDTAEAAGAYLASHRLHVDYRAGARGNRIGVTGTPTIILVGSDGRVRFFWVGELGDRDKGSLLKMLGAGRGGR